MHQLVLIIFTLLLLPICTRPADEGEKKTENADEDDTEIGKDGEERRENGAVEEVTEFRVEGEVDEEDLEDVGADEDEESSAGAGDEEDLEWVNVAVKDIAYYLRSHKFNDFDRRYYRSWSAAPKDFFMKFPSPPLRTLHWEVRKNCEPGFLSCVQYLHDKVLLAEMRRQDDTVTIIRDKRLNVKNATVMNQTDAQCRRMYQLDFLGAVPFMGPLERFQWRTTASYYMCWYAMREVKHLVLFGEPCDNFAKCLDPERGAHNADPRAADALPYACAMYSFCPDPCCPWRHLRSMQECWQSALNPCFEAATTEAGVEAAAGARRCALARSSNTDFVSLVLARWNVTCNCSAAGYAWDPRYQTCVDVDECSNGTHNCDPDSQACFNLPGAFRCGCRWGYLFDAKARACVASDVLGQTQTTLPTAAPTPGTLKEKIVHYVTTTTRRYFEELRVSFTFSRTVRVMPLPEILHLILLLLVMYFIIFQQR